MSLFDRIGATWGFLPRWRLLLVRYGILVRAVLPLCFVASLLAACLADPQLEPLAVTDQSTLPSSPAPTDAAAADAVTFTDPDATAAEPAPPAADAAAPEPPPPPPPVTCPPAGAPAGTACCGSSPCIGLACAHCGDCLAKGCAAGTICCATVTGKPDNDAKYKGMSCRPVATAGTCPR